MRVFSPVQSQSDDFVAGDRLRRYAWFPVVATSLVTAGRLVVLALPLARNVTGGHRWSDARWQRLFFRDCLFLRRRIQSSTPRYCRPCQRANSRGCRAERRFFSALGGTTARSSTDCVRDIW